ncbi:MAG: class I SAM-dependent methyltransferase [archaeon]|jgi:SAM-dependent methyltransferase
MQIRPSRIKRLKKEELFSKSSARSSERAIPVFEHANERKMWVYRSAVKNKGFTWSGRYNVLTGFLNLYKNKIKVFADIGAGNIGGAPTTIDAKKVLNPGTKVYAVDRNLSEENLKRDGIKELKHRITISPLPFQCDAIRFANVAQYMAEEDFVKALDNIWHSLKPHGFLLSAGPMEAITRSPDITSFKEKVLIKVKKTKKYPFGFVELKLFDKQGKYLGP